MSVAKYYDGITLMQPVDQVGRIERLSAYNRNNQKKDQNETKSGQKKNDPFEAFFKTATKNVATNCYTSNGFDVRC